MAALDPTSEKVRKLELRVKKLEKRIDLVEDSFLSLEDMKAILQAEDDVKSGRLVPLSKIKSELA